MPNIGLMISATDANDVWHDYIQTLKGAITTPGVIYKAKPLHGAAGVDYSAYYAAARQLIQDGVDLIVTAGNLAAQACKDATTQTQINPTPIVVASAGDLAELADGNLTGCTNGQQNIDILKARIGKMSQFNPKPTAVGIVGNDTVPPVGWAMHQVGQTIAHCRRFISTRPNPGIARQCQVPWRRPRLARAARRSIWRIRPGRRH